MVEALDIQVTGIVQGVGFRPFVYRLAKKYLINGWVLNASDGVFIHAEGEAAHLDGFVLELAENPPAAALVEEVSLKEVPLEPFDSFEIRFSDASAVEKTTLISPDLATCDDCARELFDAGDRRYRYPFINCTNCGPRFTIIDALPYDRKNTSMAGFPMCPQCTEEYDDPLDRRFHAQPDACFLCGPCLSWKEAKASPDDITWGATREESDALLARAVDYLERGKIVAVKGLGGFHLACDAQNASALATLRERKRRKGQAFATMMADLGQVREYCEVNDAEERLLTGAQHPIVLCKKKMGAHFAPGLADGLSELGVMLPYTPIQHLLARDFGKPIVMTSGNLHDEPIVVDDEEAYEVLADVADAFLGHNRSIVARYDDSVMRVIRVADEVFSVQCIRRARGYAPMPVPLPKGGQGGGGPAAAEDALQPRPSVFAAGPEQKNCFCLTRGDEAFVSQHIGDLENVETFDAWLESKERFERLFEIGPQLVACDRHPEYLSTKWAHSQDLPVTEVQHHHAHIVSVMAENKLEAPVAGIAFDGTGYGADGRIWGGEVLLCNVQAFERFANFAYVPMPGGVAAVKNPLRMAFGVLWAFDLLDHPVAQRLVADMGDQAAVCEQMIDKGINTPFTSSVGRLFDAASAILGVCRSPRYEGEGAILLEAAMAVSSPADTALSAPLEFDRASIHDSYRIELVKNTAASGSTAEDTSVLLFDAAPVFAALLEDMAAGVETSRIARRFHNAFVQAVSEVARVIKLGYGIETIALSGGVFMNRYLIEHAVESLTCEGFTVALNRELPPNDGCISFGQAVVALAGKNE